MGAFTMRQGRIALTMCLAVVVMLLGLLAPQVSQATLTGVCGPLTSEDAQVGFWQKSLPILGSLLPITLQDTSVGLNAGFIVADAFDVPTGAAAALFCTTDPAFAPFRE